MQISFVAVAGLLAGIASAQYPGVPPCAQECVRSSLPDSCQLDIDCICSDDAFISGISCCVANACDAEGQTSALNAASSICAGAEVQLPTAAGCSDSSAPAATTTTTAAESNTPTGSVTSISGSGPTGTVYLATSSSATPGLGNHVAVNGMGLAGALLGVAAML